MILIEHVIRQASFCLSLIIDERNRLHDPRRNRHPHHSPAHRPRQNLLHQHLRPLRTNTIAPPLARTLATPAHRRHLVARGLHQRQHLRRRVLVPRVQGRAELPVQEHGD